MRLKGWKARRRATPEQGRLAEVAGAELALKAVEAIASELPFDWSPLRALRADLYARLGRRAEAVADLDAVLAGAPPPAERLWLERRRAALT